MFQTKKCFCVQLTTVAGELIIGETDALETIHLPELLTAQGVFIMKKTVFNGSIVTKSSNWNCFSKELKNTKFSSTPHCFVSNHYHLFTKFYNSNFQSCVKFCYLFFVAAQGVFIIENNGLTEVSLPNLRTVQNATEESHLYISDNHLLEAIYLDQVIHYNKY